MNTHYTITLDIIVNFCWSNSDFIKTFINTQYGCYTAIVFTLKMQSVHEITIQWSRKNIF